MRTFALILLISSGLSGDIASGHEQEADSVTKNFTKLYKHNLEQLVKILNNTVDPCYDFYAHACGNFQSIYGSGNEVRAENNGMENVYEDNIMDGFVEQKAREEAEETVPPFLYNREDRMHFFDEEYQNFATRPGRILSELYTQCKARNEYNVLSPQAPQSHWERMLEQIDFLAHNIELYSGWPYLRHQWTRQNKRFELNWVALAAQFSVHGLPSLLHVYFAEQTIFISPLENLHCPTLEEFKKSLEPVLIGRNSQIAHVIGQELRVFCRDLRGELPPLSGEDMGDTNATAEKNILIDDNTVEYFQHFFALLNFTEFDLEHARKLPTNVQRIGEIRQLLRRTEPRIIFNFILWHAHENLKYEDCYLLTEEFERLLLTEYWHWDVFAMHFRRNVAMAMYIHHTTRFQQKRKTQLLGTVDWYRYLMEPNERKDFNTIRGIRAHAQSYLNVEELTNEYASLLFTPNAFYANLLKLRKLNLRLSFTSVIIDNEDLNHPAYFLRQFLDFCILSLKQPMFHYYSSQGFELWNSNLLYDSDGFYTALDCLERQSLRNIDDEFPQLYRMLSSHEVNEVFQFYRAFVESYDDYRFWLEGESFAFAEDFVLQYFKLDSKRILFYAVAQQYCNRNEQLYAAQINRSFMNMQAFQDAFNCTVEAPMNPLAKCMIRKCD